MKSIYIRIKSSIHAGLIAASMLTLPVQAGDDVQKDETLEQINARIESLENALVAEQAERYRAKHQVLYTDRNFEKKRLDVKVLESELLDLREAYNERIRIFDEDVRKMQSRIRTLYEKNRDLALLADAIRNEIDFASEDGAGKPDLLAKLKDDLDETNSQIETNKSMIGQIEKDLAARCEKIEADDPTAGELAAAIKQKSAEYEAAFARLNSDVDRETEVQQLDEGRYKLAGELQELRKKRDEILKKTGE